jgi:hypothetical protein
VGRGGGKTKSIDGVELKSDKPSQPTNDRQAADVTGGARLVTVIIIDQVYLLLRVCRGGEGGRITRSTLC